MDSGYNINGSRAEPMRSTAVRHDYEFRVAEREGGGVAHGKPRFEQINPNPFQQAVADLQHKKNAIRNLGHRGHQPKKEITPAIGPEYDIKGPLSQQHRNRYPVKPMIPTVWFDEPVQTTISNKELLFNLDNPASSRHFENKSRGNSNGHHAHAVPAHRDRKSHQHPQDEKSDLNDNQNHFQYQSHDKNCGPNHYDNTKDQRAPGPSDSPLLALRTLFGSATLNSRGDRSYAEMVHRNRRPFVSVETQEHDHETTIMPTSWFEGSTQCSQANKVETTPTSTISTSIDHSTHPNSYHHKSELPKNTDSHLSQIAPTQTHAVAPKFSAGKYTYAEAVVHKRRLQDGQQTQSHKHRAETPTHQHPLPQFTFNSTEKHLDHPYDTSQLNEKQPPTPHNRSTVPTIAAASAALASSALKEAPAFSIPSTDATSSINTTTTTKHTYISDYQKELHRDDDKLISTLPKKNPKGYLGLHSRFFKQPLSPDYYAVSSSPKRIKKIIAINGSKAIDSPLSAQRQREHISLAR
ncbi:hypothetical protein FBU30_008929 [Linnemannia zychae]|nr:hypothetical protein FBU30_008929 [Linnemannia zychae]